jgi:hypothetical protein
MRCIGDGNTTGTRRAHDSGRAEQERSEDIRWLYCSHTWFGSDNKYNLRTYVLYDTLVRVNPHCVLKMLCFTYLKGAPADE